MNSMNWSIQTTEADVLPIVVSEYLLNEMGVFIKSELRMPKKSVLTAVTGFRIGYEPVKGTDYRMAPWKRNAILWHKITSVVEEKPGTLLIYGNTSDVITVVSSLENSERVFQFIQEKRIEFPPVIEADPVAVAWMCWRDDDEWEDRYMSITDMVKNESKEKRFIEDDLLDETVLDEESIEKLEKKETVTKIQSEIIKPTAESKKVNRPKFCGNCGSTLPADGVFCENCGTKFM